MHRESFIVCLLVCLSLSLQSTVSSSPFVVLILSTLCVHDTLCTFESWCSHQMCYQSGFVVILQRTSPAEECIISKEEQEIFQSYELINHYLNDCSSHWFISLYYYHLPINSFSLYKNLLSRSRSQNYWYPTHKLLCFCANKRVCAFYRHASLIQHWLDDFLFYLYIIKTDPYNSLYIYLRLCTCSRWWDWRSWLLAQAFRI